MFVTFDKEGVLHIKPQNHADAMTLKWFMKEFATHGARMLNVETEVDERNASSIEGISPEYQFAESAYGYSDGRQGLEQEYGPQGRYDNVVRNFMGARGGQGGGGGGQGGNSGGGSRGEYTFGIQNTRDRNPNNGR